MTEKTIGTAFGDVTLRRPTEREVLAKMQKRLNVETGKYPVDALDDGDEEVLDCVTAPERAQVEEWLDEAPLLMDLLDKAFDELAGQAAEVQPAGRGELPAELQERHGARLVAVRHGGTLYGLTRLARVEFKLVKRNRDYMAAVAALGRGHLVHGTIDAAAWPSLAAQLGTHLLLLASKKVEADVGKSPSSSAKSQPPTS